MYRSLILLNISAPEIIAFLSLIFGAITLCCIGVSRIGDDPSRSEFLYCIPMIWGIFLIFVTLFTSNLWIFVVGCVFISLFFVLRYLYFKHRDQITEHELRTWSGKLDEQPLSLKDIKDLAESRGGQLLSDQFVNVYKTLRWRCGNGHQWDATPSAIYRGNWCPLCTWRAEFGKRHYQLQTLQKIAISHSGMCLSTQYVNESTPLRWQCHLSHEWDASAEEIRKGKWCPRCTELLHKK